MVGMFSVSLTCLKFSSIFLKLGTADDQNFWTAKIEKKYFMFKSFKTCGIWFGSTQSQYLGQARFGKYHKISYTKKSDKMTYANSADPDQTAPSGAVWSGSTLFAIQLRILRNSCIKSKI